MPKSKLFIEVYNVMKYLQKNLILSFPILKNIPLKVQW